MERAFPYTAPADEGAERRGRRASRWRLPVRVPATRPTILGTATAGARCVRSYEWEKGTPLQEDRHVAEGVGLFEGHEGKGLVWSVRAGR